MSIEQAIKGQKGAEKCQKGQNKGEVHQIEISSGE
jgi:hypothetical protein